jgi:hypothetical protein
VLSFLRKLRRKENRFTRYSLYAIGEIFLVVVGILIALQINTWNEGRKERAQELLYLTNLKADLETQIKQLDQNIDYENIIIDHSADIIAHYEANKGFLNMDTIFPKLSDLTTRWTFSNLNNTLKEMINSGQINLISDETLKKELMQFFQTVEIFAVNSDKNMTNFVDNFTARILMERGDYAHSGFSERMENKFGEFYLNEVVRVSDEELGKIATENLNVPEERLRIINLVTLRNMMSHMEKTGNEALKVKAQNILTKVERALKEV